MTIKPRSLRLLGLQKDVFCGRAYCRSSLRRWQHTFSKSAVSSLSPLCTERRKEQVESCRQELPAAGAHATPVSPSSEGICCCCKLQPLLCFISINLSSVHKNSEVSTIIIPSYKGRHKSMGRWNNLLDVTLLVHGRGGTQDKLLALSTLC